MARSTCPRAGRSLNSRARCLSDNPASLSKPLETLRAIEESIALTDSQRLLILQTTDLAVATVVRENWPELRVSYALTAMIARRMFNHYKAQKKLKSEISLATIPSASGLFQQAVGTYLRAYLRAVDQSFNVHLDKGYGKLHPDVAIEAGGTPRSAIEVKTDLGWDRTYVSEGGWQKRREALIGEGFRDVHLLILANANWSGWQPSMEGGGIHVMLWTSPNNTRFKWYENEDADLVVGATQAADVLHPVEPLFEEIAPWRTANGA
jgi:hypothetical protein